jgi:hypothetical protein
MDNIKQDKTILQIITSDCWKCSKPMKLAILISGGTFCDPSEFNEDQIKVARNNGVILQENYSNTLQEKYLANTCGHCGAFIGKFFIDDYLYDPGCKEIEL